MKDAKSPVMTPKRNNITLVRNLPKEWLKDPEYLKEYEPLESEFALVGEVSH